MKTRLLTLLLVASASFSSAAAHAGPINYSIDGQFTLYWGSDHLGLDGTQFNVLASPNQLISHHEPHTIFAANDRHLTLNGSTASGTITHSQANQSTWTTDGNSYDALRIGGSRYDLDGYILQLAQIQINFAEGTLADGIDLLPLFAANEVTGMTQVRLDIWNSGQRVARYYTSPGSLSASATSVPTPGTMGLVLVGLIMTGLLRYKAARN